MKLKSIEIDQVSKKFREHILLEGNDRILFSGRYGIGKTYFLTNFFEKEKNNGLHAIRISPINYSVKSNEDVFEYIKADILFSLFKNNLLEVDEKLELVEDGNFVERLIDFFADFKSLNRYYQSNLPKLFSGLLAKLNSVQTSGEGIFFISSLGLVISSFVSKKYNEGKIASKGDKYPSLDEFWKKIENSPSSWYEQSIINEIIKDSLKNISDNEEKSILIVDDLDRVAPDHVFRILNVLFVNDNYLNIGNKFGFDRIVLVGDLENLKQMFFHKFGKGVDFDGYIDKFYSVEIFRYSNDDAINFYFANQFQTNLKEDSHNFLRSILQWALESKNLNLRQLFKFKHFDAFRIPNFKVLEIDYNITRRSSVFVNERSGHLVVKAEKLSLLSILYILKLIWGSTENLKSRLRDMHEFYSANPKSDMITIVQESTLSPLIAFFALINNLNEPQNFFFQFSEMNMVPHYGTFLGVQYQFRLKWGTESGKENLYNSGDDYFEDFSVELKQPIRSSDITKSSIKVTKIIEKIEDCLNLVLSHDMFSRYKNVLY